MSVHVDFQDSVEVRMAAIRRLRREISLVCMPCGHNDGCGIQDTQICSHPRASFEAKTQRIGTKAPQNVRFLYKPASPAGLIPHRVVVVERWIYVSTGSLLKCVQEVAPTNRLFSLDWRCSEGTPY